MPNKWEDKYPLSTFKGETRIELIEFISGLLKQERQTVIEQIRNGEVCTYCGAYIANGIGLSEWCTTCLEEE